MVDGSSGDNSEFDRDNSGSLGKMISSCCFAVGEMIRASVASGTDFGLFCCIAYGLLVDVPSGEVGASHSVSWRGLACTKFIGVAVEDGNGGSESESSP